LVPSAVVVSQTSNGPPMMIWNADEICDKIAPNKLYDTGS
jgi:hypothetical protein